MKYTLEELHEMIKPMIESLGSRSVDELTGAIVEVIKQDREANKITGDTSDGYHTFNELYEYRKLYNAGMFNQLYRSHQEYDVHKSIRHSDGELCFGGGWFIVMAQLPTGQISNHYEMDDWDLFDIEEREKAATFDGHTPADVAKRLEQFLRSHK